MHPTHFVLTLPLAVAALVYSSPAFAADSANDEARRCASVYGRVMEANPEGSAGYMAALQGRLRLINQIEKSEGRFDGPALLASDEAVTAKFKQAPAGLRSAVAGCDRAFGQTVSSGIAQTDSPYNPPAPPRDDPPRAIAAAPPPSPPAPTQAQICEKLDNQAAELINTYRYRAEEVADDPYDNKRGRLRDSYDVIREKLGWVRDDASYKGCPQLAGQITDALGTWERP